MSNPFVIPPPVLDRIAAFTDELARMEFETDVLHGFGSSTFANDIIALISDQVSDTAQELRRCLPGENHAGRLHITPGMLDKAGNELADMAAFLSCLGARAPETVRAGLNGVSAKLAEYGETAAYLAETTLDHE